MLQKRYTQLSSLRAASVPSQVAGGLRQLSQLPQGSLLSQNRPTAAHAGNRGFGQSQQGIELGALNALEILVSRAFINHAALVHHIGQTVSQPGIGLAPSRPARPVSW